VRVRIALDDRIPILQGTTATIQGSFTGVSNIQLAGGVKGKPPIAEIGPDGVPVIPTKRSGLGELLTNAPLLMERLASLAEKLGDTLSDENQKHLAGILKNTDRLTGNLASVTPQIKDTLVNLSETLVSARDAVAEFQKVAANANRQLDPEGPSVVHHMNDTLGAAQKAAESLQAELDAARPPPSACPPTRCLRPRRPSTTCARPPRPCARSPKGWTIRARPPCWRRPRCRFTSHEGPDDAFFHNRPDAAPAGAGGLREHRRGKAPAQLYTITAAQRAPAGTLVKAKLGEALVVSDPETDRSLAMTRMAVQVNPTSIAYLKDANWVERPSRLLRNLLAEDIRASGKRLVLLDDDSESQVGLHLGGRLLAMGYDAQKHSAVIRFDAVLGDGKGGVTMRRFEVSEPDISPNGASLAQG
jgi:ABC-type uncharacterized transport system auxiliary subunit/flagellar hook-basal body complex protein FliE